MSICDMAATLVANTVVAVERIRSGGALSSASSSRKMACGRVLGSKYSMR